MNVTLIRLKQSCQYSYKSMVLAGFHTYLLSLTLTYTVVKPKVILPLDTSDNWHVNILQTLIASIVKSLAHNSSYYYLIKTELLYIYSISYSVTDLNTTHILTEAYSFMFLVEWSFFESSSWCFLDPALLIFWLLEDLVFLSPTYLPAFSSYLSPSQMWTPVCSWSCGSFQKQMTIQDGCSILPTASYLLVAWANSPPWPISWPNPWPPP